jgi:hypothetical protein
MPHSVVILAKASHQKAKIKGFPWFDARQQSQRRPRTRLSLDWLAVSKSNPA